MLAANNMTPNLPLHFKILILFSSAGPQIFQEDMMRSLLQNSLHVFRAISGTSTDLSQNLMDNQLSSHLNVQIKIQAFSKHLFTLQECQHFPCHVFTCCVQRVCVNIAFTIHFNGNMKSKSTLFTFLMHIPGLIMFASMFLLGSHRQATLFFNSYHYGILFPPHKKTRHGFVYHNYDIK